MIGRAQHLCLKKKKKKKNEKGRVAPVRLPFGMCVKYKRNLGFTTIFALGGRRGNELERAYLCLGGGAIQIASAAPCKHLSKSMCIADLHE